MERRRFQIRLRTAAVTIASVAVIIAVARNFDRWWALVLLPGAISVVTMTHFIGCTLADGCPAPEADPEYARWLVFCVWVPFCGITFTLVMIALRIAHLCEAG